MKPWKLQKFFGDLVYDLRNRGLLPPAVLLVIAIVAAPLIISRSGSGSESAAPSQLAAQSQSAGELAPENQAAVLAYNPGVRDYRKRLSELASKDPFKQQFAAPPAAAAAASGDATGVTGGGGTTGTTGTTGTGSGTGSATHTINYFYYETDVAVGEAGGELRRRNKVPVFSFLPSEEIPVLLFLGNVKQGKSAAAVFSVAKNVIAVEGGGDCFPSQDDCQLLVLKPGETGDLTYAVDNKIYRIKVVRVELVVSHKLPKN